MAVDAVPAAIRYADDDVDQLLGQRVEHPRRHDRFDPVPGTLQKLRLDRQRLPEVVDPVGLSRRHDIVVYLTHRRDCRVVLNQGHGCHRPPPSDLVSCTSVLDWGRLTGLRAQAWTSSRTRSAPPWMGERGRPLLGSAIQWVCGIADGPRTDEA